MSENLNLLAFFEENSDIIYFCDMKTLKSVNLKLRVGPQGKKDIYNIRGSSRKRQSYASILDFIHIEKDSKEYIMTSSNDGVIRTFEFYNKYFRLVSKIHIHQQ